MRPGAERSAARRPRPRLPRLGDRRGAVVVVALCAQVALLLVLMPTDRTRTVTLEFSSAVGIYEGSEVRLMGVPVGEVTAVEPGAAAVTVQVEYDAEHDLPADVGALIVAPSVIADRFVQLSPPYDGDGDRLADGAVVPLERTRTPVELDEVFATMDQVLVALGPRGANEEGALNEALEVGAGALRGQGPEVRRLLSRMGDATTTLADVSPALFQTVAQLGDVTRTLARDDRQVRVFEGRLDDVASFLAEDRRDLAAVLRSLAVSLGEVETFVADNRDLLVDNVEHLTRISQAVAAQQVALDGLLRVVPVALNNLNRVWDADAQAIRSRANLDQILKDLDGLICDAIIRAGIPVPPATCSRLLGGLS